MADGTRTHRRRLAHAVLAVGPLVVLVACSGEDAPSSSRAPATDETEAAPPPSSAGTASSTSAPAGTTTSTTPPATTTTTPPPVVLPTGEVWIGADVGPAVAGVVSTPRAVTIGNEVWLLGSRANSSYVWKSADGSTWDEVVIAPPLAQGATSLVDLVAAPDGRLVGIGTHSTDCDLADAQPDGTVVVGLCRRFGGLVEISADGGATWQRIEPPSMAASGDSSVILADLTVTAGGFAAIGTVRGADWYAAVWTSPDGADWTLTSQLRGPSGPTSGRRLLADAAGTTLVGLVAEHPCSRPFFTTPGWVLGSDWVDHPRLFAGPDAGSLVLQGPDLTPVAVAPTDIDCATVGQFELPEGPFQTAALVGGTIVVGRGSVEGDTATSDGWTIARLVDGVWQLVPADPTLATAPPAGGDDATGDEPAGPEPETDSVLFDAGGHIGIVDPVPDPEVDGLMAFRLRTFDPTVGDASGWATTMQTSRDLPVGRLTGAAAFASVASPPPAGLAIDIVVTGTRDVGGTTTLHAWTSRPTPEDLVVVPVCTPEPSADCFAADLTTLDGRDGDFTDVDLSGADLSFARLGSGTFDGARFVGADLSGAVAANATFVGADFAGALLHDTELGDVAGAVFTGADARGARLTLSGAAVFDGASLVAARIGRSIFLDDGVPPTIELSFANADLTSASVRGSDFVSGGLIRITDLRGAILEATNFTGVDLSGLVLDGVDLASATFDETSICPNGAPPQGEFGLKCV